MNEKGVIFLGLAVFLAAVTFPVWYNQAAGGNVARKKPEPPAGKTKCVEPKAFMTANHMVLLNEWRDKVVREGIGTYPSKAYGQEHEISLSKTCMKCHTSMKNFCQRCHDYSNVQPNCWECHVEPKGK